MNVMTAAACDKHFTDSSGTLASPVHFTGRSGNTPALTYQSNLDCEYDIQVAPGNAIRLTWFSFDVKGTMPSCANDYVEIFIGCDRRSIGKYCSENTRKELFDVYSPDNCLSLKFHSDSKGGGKGFRASYNTISYSSDASKLQPGVCNSTKTLSAPSEGTIRSPGWPHSYPQLTDCYWKIDFENNKSIKIVFMDFDLKCDNAKVTIKGGQHGQSWHTSRQIEGLLCGASKDPFFLSLKEERIWIRFKAGDLVKSGRGFVAGYITYDSAPGSSSESSSPLKTVFGTVFPAIVLFLVVGALCRYKYYRNRRPVTRQAPQEVHAATPQAIVHKPPPLPQPGYGPAPSAVYPDYAPPSYSQVAPPPYPQQGAIPYSHAQPGGVPPYPPEQPGGTPFYPTPPGGTAPYSLSSPGGAPYPPRV